MPNARKILIVDDDPQLRDALTEQLLLHEEFEAAAAVIARGRPDTDQTVTTTRPALHSTLIWVIGTRNFHGL